MLVLRTFGAIDLRLQGGAVASPLLTQPKRVALLVYLALQGGGFVRRDTLLAMLWPELDAERGRHALRQTLYGLRQALGGTAILNRGEEELGVDAAALSCDAMALDALLKTGKREAALDLYQGDFLAGFHPPDTAEEFEDWIAATRHRYRTLALGAASGLLADATRAGQIPAAIDWARRAVQVDPLDEPAQRELIVLLARSGDRAGAERAFRSYADRLQRELGSAPSMVMRDALALAERTVAPVGAGAGAATLVPAPLSGPAPVLPVPDARPVVHRRFTLRRLAIAGVLVLLGAVVGRVLFSTSEPSGRPILAVAAIQEVGVAGDSSRLLPIADLLATSLARLPSPQVVSNARLIEVEQALSRGGRTPSTREVARQVGATEILEGTLFRMGGDSLVLELRRSELAGGTVRHGYRVSGRDLFALVDLATAAMAREAGVAGPAEGIADVATGSLVAYRFYQEGLRSFYAGDPTAARRLFEAAVGDDPGFAMATWYLARVEAMLGVAGVYDRYLKALDLARGASDRERLLITAHVHLTGNAATGRAIAETLATRYPADRDGLWVLGAARAAMSDHPGAIDAFRRTLEMDSLLPVRSGSACRLCESFSQLVTAHLWADSLEKALSLTKAFARRVPESEAAWSSLLGIAVILNDSAAWRLADRELYRIHPGPRPVRVSGAVIYDLYWGHYRPADSALAALWTLDRAVRPDAMWHLLISLRNQGRLDAALALARDGAPPGGRRGPPAPDSLLIAVVLFDRGDYHGCGAFYRALARSGRLEELRADWPGTAAREETWALARLAMCRAAARDTSGFEALADSLRQTGAISQYGRDQRLHHYVRGLLWKERGDPARAAAEFQQAISSPNMGFTRINYHLAEAQLALGRPTEAIRALRPALRGALDASNLYLTRTEIHELLARAWDQARQPDSARVHWAAVESAWRNADAAFRERWATARERATEDGPR